MSLSKTFKFSFHKMFNDVQRDGILQTENKCEGNF